MQVLADDRIIELEPSFVAHICEATRYLYVSNHILMSNLDVSTVRVWDDVERIAIAGAKGLTDTRGANVTLKECVSSYLRQRAYPQSAANIAKNKLTLAFLR